MGSFCFIHILEQIINDSDDLLVFFAEFVHSVF